MGIIFKAETHKYESTPDEVKQIDWLSVTTLVSLFKKPFEQIVIAEKASKNKNGKWYGKTPDEIIAIWNSETNRAITLGSWYHGEREMELLMCDTIERSGLALPIIKPIEENSIKIAPDQCLSSGIYPEHFMFLKSAGVCGQADRVEVLYDVIDLYDYKTNKEIKTVGFTSWDNITQKMLGPCSHLDDCNLNHYALQLSVYMYIMLKHNHNLKPGKLQIHHVVFEKSGEDEFGYPITSLDTAGNPIVKEVIPYNVPYLKKEVQDMINHIKLYPDIINTKKK